MDDILCCPICGEKFRNGHYTKKLLHETNKTSDYVNRICSGGHNHVVALWTDKVTGKVDLLRLSLNSKYSRFLELDYVNKKCRITCAKDGEYTHIDIPKMIEPDFPDLTKLKERVSLYILFS